MAPRGIAGRYYYFLPKSLYTFCRLLNRVPVVLLDYGAA